MPRFPLIDAHEDLAWNMLTFGRDYTLDAYEIRERERRANAIAPQVNGETLLGWPQYQQAGVVLAFATLFVAPSRKRSGAWEKLVYDTPEEAAHWNREQLAAYRRLVEDHPTMFTLITHRQAFEDLWQRSTQNLEQEHPVGLVLLMENAEGILTPEEDVPWWYEQGLRILGPAWAGTRFCGGTGEPGPLTDEGRRLLRAMAEVGLALDVSHMDEAAVLEALDTYPGVVLASHANPQKAVGIASNRFLSDRVLQGLFERDAVIGVVPYNRFLQAGWKPADGKQAVPLRRVAEVIDYICQKAGSARHVGIGSDFDGGFGREHTPAEIDTIADLPQLADILAQWGYIEADIRAIFAENWRRVLLQVLP